MAVILEGGCRASYMHDGESLDEGTIRVWQQIGRATGAQAISLHVIEFAPGMSPAIRNDDCDQILYLLDLERGHAARMSERNEREAPGPSATILIEGRSYEIAPDTGIYIRPRETFAINNPSLETITIVSSQCPDPDREPEFVTPPKAIGTTRPLPRQVGVLTSSDRSPIVRLADQKARPTADRWYRVMVDDGLGSINATQFVGSIPPGRAPDHFHNYEEVLFILKGEGRMWAGETNTPIGVGSCIYLPKGQVHCVENTGQGELRLMGVFYPAGSPSVRYEA